MLCLWYLSEKSRRMADFTVPTTKLINFSIHPKLFYKKMTGDYSSPVILFHIDISCQSLLKKYNTPRFMTVSFK